MMYALFVAENFLVRLWELSRIRVENRNRETECASGQNFPEILEFLYRRILLEFYFENGNMHRNSRIFLKFVFNLP